MIVTKIDTLVELLQKNKRMTFPAIAKELSWNVSSVERILLILENAKLVRTNYPLTMIQSPWASLLVSPMSVVSIAPNDSSPLLEYKISAHENHTKGRVIICASSIEKRPVYTLFLEDVSTYVRSYLESVKTEASSKLSLATLEVGAQESSKTFGIRHKLISEIVKKDLEESDPVVDELTDIILNEMYGLGKIEALIGDEMLEEIVMNSSRQPISVYHRKYGWLKTNVLLADEAEIENYAEQIARKVGRQISILNPILDAHLGTGDRVNATLAPISAEGNTITMRLFARNPWTMISYLKPEVNSMSYEMAAILWQAIQYELNILIAGGTASGKTSALNGILALIQPFQRIVTIEDTRELMLPRYQWNWVPMVTRQPNLEGVGEVTMLDLVVNALRMRPDRIVMGEIRRKREAEVLFEAMHTGHSVYSTIHADTASQVIKRLTEPPIDIPPAEVEDLHLIVVQYRDRRKNVRRTLEISEVVPGEGIPELNHLFAWKPRTDTFQAVKAPRRYLEQMNLHTGMTEREVQSDQDQKVKIMYWMTKYALDKVNDVGRVMKEYYSEPADVLDAVEKDLPPNKVL